MTDAERIVKIREFISNHSIGTRTAEGSELPWLLDQLEEAQQEIVRLRKENLRMQKKLAERAAWEPIGPGTWRPKDAS